MSELDAAEAAAESSDGSTNPKLAALLAVSGTLITIATNPVQFLKGPVLTIVLETFVIKPVAWVYAYLLEAFGILEDAILSVAPILAGPFRWAGDLWTGTIGALYGGVRATFLGLGLGAPIAGALAVAIGLVVLFTLIYATWKLVPGTDVLEGVTQWRS